MSMQCPNCKDRLVHYRTDHQRAGERNVLLQWSICPLCRHVALEHWELGSAGSEDRIKVPVRSGVG